MDGRTDARRTPLAFGAKPTKLKGLFSVKSTVHLILGTLAKNEEWSSRSITWTGHILRCQIKKKNSLAKRVIILSRDDEKKKKHFELQKQPIIKKVRSTLACADGAGRPESKLFCVCVKPPFSDQIEKKICCIQIKVFNIGCKLQVAIDFMLKNFIHVSYR